MPKLSPAKQKLANKRRAATIAKKKRGKTRTYSRRSCAANQARTETGGCSTRVPCMDIEGNILPYAIRGADGRCRIKPCGAGSIMDPTSGRCISTNTPHGERLALAKKAQDANQFLRAYDQATKQAGAVNEGYYDMFKPEDFRKRQLAENRRRREDIRLRYDEADKKKQERERLHRENIGIVNGVKRYLGVGLPSKNPFAAPRPEAGGSSFSFF